MKKVRKIYDKAFKEKAVLLSYERTNISESTRELVITAPQLYKFYSSLQDVEDFITSVVKKTREKEVMSICGYAYAFLDQVWSVK